MSAHPSDADTIYLDLMIEIKDRLQAIHRCCIQEIAEPMFQKTYLAAEFVLVQLRMICEMIAVGCIVAHEIDPRNDLKKEYSASRIFYELEKLKPEYFPDPVQAIIDPKTGVINYEPQGNAISREELKVLYERCNELIHRIKWKEAVARKRRIYPTDYFFECADKIANLLDIHLIKIALEEKMIRVTMNGPTGAVHWDVLSRDPAAP